MAPARSPSAPGGSATSSLPTATASALRDFDPDPKRGPTGTFLSISHTGHGVHADAADVEQALTAASAAWTSWRDNEHVGLHTRPSA